MWFVGRKVACELPDVSGSPELWGILHSDLPAPSGLWGQEEVMPSSALSRASEEKDSEFSAT